MKSISTAVFDELLTTIEVIGVDRTVRALQDAKADNLILEDLNIDFVLKCVADSTTVSKERILHGNDRNDQRKIAVSLAVYFIKNHFSYSLSDLKKIFCKDESALSRYNSVVEKFVKTTGKPKTQFDKELDYHYKRINLLITEKKLKDAKL